MASKTRAAPRKKPLQRRSKEMVEVLVEATTRVLLKDGYEACTTNRVAEVAGVSIGSVHQYFPHKESLVLAVMGRHQEQLQTAMVLRLSELANADLPTAVHEMIGAARLGGEVLSDFRLPSSTWDTFAQQVATLSLRPAHHEEFTVDAVGAGGPVSQRLHSQIAAPARGIRDSAR